jgi:hypothetical protein
MSQFSQYWSFKIIILAMLFVYFFHFDLMSLFIFEVLENSLAHMVGESNTLYHSLRMVLPASVI